MPGILYIVATPIGNLGDLTLRAIETLKTADLVACEDTRHTEKLMRHLGLRKPLFRYDEHTHERAGQDLMNRLLTGTNVALVTDAGTPGISDPGTRLVSMAWKAGIRVVPIPGPSSLTAALSASGFGSNGHVFVGFLPRRPGRLRRVLQEGLGLGKTLVVFESPFRIQETLKSLVEMNVDVTVAVVRELTKIHEEFLRGRVPDVLNQLKSRPTKGEVVLLIEPSAEPFSKSTMN